MTCYTSCFPQSEQTNQQRKYPAKKELHADSLASGCLVVCMCECVCVGLQVCQQVSFFVSVHMEFTPLPWCKCVSIKDFARGLVSKCVFWHFKLCFLPLFLLLLPLLFFSLSPPGCLQDVRFNGRSIPLDQEQPSEGLQVVTSQGVSVGCSSEACRKHHCSPPLVCVDLWRHHECRCCKYTG